MKDPYLLSSYRFDLPQELIAQIPITPRNHSRLMVVDRASGKIEDKRFYDLVEFLESGDSLVFNDTKVIPARLLGRRRGGGAAEIFLVRRRSLDEWEALARPGRKLPVGAEVVFGEDLKCTVNEVLADGGRLVKFRFDGSFEEALGRYGQIPLPHYIQRDKATKDDSERYQTVYAKNLGAVAAPTAGLHFTQEMLEDLSQKGIRTHNVTLHVGLGTFRPVQADDIREHKMHSEQVIITPEAAEALNNRPLDKRQICVGTTCCRSLESSASAEGIISPGSFDTDIFIYPGYKFKYVNHMITNFHLPGSTLLMLCSAFAGYELIMEAYAKAVKDRYRFFSYGDAMLIL